MEDIKKSREEINIIDKQMAELFEKRMSAVKSICEYKMKKGIPVEDKGREAEVVFQNSEYINDDDIREYYVSFIKDTMAISRAYQHRLMEGLKVEQPKAHRPVTGLTAI